MEVSILYIGMFVLLFVGCSNSPEIEGAGEKTINQLVKTFQKIEIDQNQSMFVQFCQGQI